MSKALATKNVAAVLLGAALVVTFAFSFATPVKADTLTDLQSQVQALLAQIAALQGGSSTGGSTMSGAGCHTFTQNLKKGSTGGEVMWVQQFLNGHGFQVAASGAGSPGNETSTFGPATAAAVKKFQEANAADILTPVGLTTGTGNWFAATRAKANAMCAGGSTGGNTGGNTGGVGGSLMISAGTQPANSLAPAGAVRVPFTTFTITNTSGAAVTVNGVTVQRTGLAQDNNFSSIVLVDSNGLQVGYSQTFDSNHMATVGGTWTINPGQSQTFTVAGNMAAAATIHSGEVASIAVTGVNVSGGTVGGSLPITGAMHTMNSTLTVGTVTPSVSSFDPVNSQTKNIGDTAIKFSGIRFTAGSGEDLKFYSIRWRVNGSASSADLANVKTVINGTTYDTSISADGRYYTTVVPGGILIQKGNSIDAYIQGDLVGSNASGRTVIFDIDRTSDVYFVGQTYGYGIGMATGQTGGTYNATTHTTSGFNTSNQPWFTGAQVTVQGGSVTTIQNATAVASQNVAVNVPNQVLGGFQTNFRGEPVTVQGMTFTIATTSTGAGQITLVSIVDENGSVVAGPVDASGSGSGTYGSLVFSNSVTFPTGTHTYTLKGKLPSSFSNGGTIRLTTDPSSTWTSPQGQVSGTTVSLSGATSFQMNVMTVRGATLSIAAGSTPSAQNVVVGGQNVVLASVQLDASQSGEDIRLATIPLTVTEGVSNDNDYLTGCALWDGTTQLNTGSNVVNMNAITNPTTAVTVSLDNSLTVTKGTVKTLNFTCNLSASAPTSGDSIAIGVPSVGSWTATGLQSGTALTSSNMTSAGNSSGTQTFSSGATVTFQVDTATSPSYTITAGGSTGVTLGSFKIRSANEAFNLMKVGLRASSTVAANAGQYGTKSTGAGNAATAAGDMTTVYLYNGATLLGTATFVGSNTTATSTFSSPLTVARDTDVLITVKADLAQIGVSGSAGIGNLVTVDPLNFEGTGASSGTTKAGAGSGSTGGVRLFKSYPTVAIDTLSSSGVADSRLMRFKVTSSSGGPIGIARFTFNLATSSAAVTNVMLKGYNDSSYSNPIGSQGNGGQIGSTACSTGCTSSSPNLAFAPTNPVQVSGTVYFELTGTVGAVGGATSYNVVTKLLGDSSMYFSSATTTYNVDNAANINSAGGMFVWSGNSTSTSATSDVDWSNGYTVSGLPSSGLIQNRSN